MTNILRVTEPRELLALIPYQLGFTPEKSVVAVSLRGSRQRVGVIARSDSADVTGLEGDLVAASMMQCLLNDGALRFVIVVYDDEPARHGDSRALDVVNRMAQNAPDPIELAALWWVSSQGCQVAAPSCVPTQGIRWADKALPLADLEATQVSATMVMNGVAVHPHRQNIADLMEIEPEVQRRVGAVADRWWRRRVGAAADGTDGAAAVFQWCDQSIRLWVAALNEVEEAEAVRASTPGGTAIRSVSESVQGRIGAALRDSKVRDSILAVIIMRSVEELVQNDSGRLGNDAVPALESVIDKVMDPHRGVPPDSGRLRIWCDVLQRTAAFTRRKHRADAFAMLALLSWWDGSGAKARVWCEAATAVNEQHRLTALVQQILDAGVPPGWVRRHAWAVAE